MDIRDRLHAAHLFAERAVVLGAGTDEAAKRLQTLMEEMQACLDRILEMATAPGEQVTLADHCVGLEQQLKALRCDLDKAEATNAYWDREAGPLQAAKEKWESEAKAAQRLYLQARQRLMRYEPEWKSMA